MRSSGSARTSPASPSATASASLSLAGSYAELALAPVFLASRIPDGASAVEAVALVRSGHVALAALSTARPQRAESYSSRARRAASAIWPSNSRVSRGCAGSSPPSATRRRRTFLRGLGADEVVAYDDESWGEPVDTSWTASAATLLPRALAALAPAGRLVFFNSGGGTVPAYDLLVGRQDHHRADMAASPHVHPSCTSSTAAQLWRLFAEGRLRPAVHAEMPLDEAAKAHEIIEASANLGKVVLRP